MSQPLFDATKLGVSPEASARLQANRAGTPGAVFASDLSVNEFVLVREAGFRPVGFVMGTSVFHIGFQAGNWSQNMELTNLSAAMYQGRAAAFGRMQAEAHALGADGVVGVGLEVRAREWGAAVSEFIAIGTAVTAEAPPPAGGSWRDDQGRPFTSLLSGQDLWALLQSGYAPVGLVMGTCVYHVAHQRMGQVLRNMRDNVEIPQFTQGVYDAREIAMGRMHGEAAGLRAEGVVGFEIAEFNHAWGHHATEFFALGTAIRPTGAPRPATAPSMTYPLTG